MANRKNPKSARKKEGKSPAAESGSGRCSEETTGGTKFYTWLMLLALLGVWSSLAVVYFDIVDYESVLDRAQEFHSNFSQALQGKLSSYDSDGDGDFDMDDAKILLGVGQPPGAEPAEERIVFSDHASQSTNQQQHSGPASQSGAEHPTLAEEDFVPDSASGAGADAIDTSGVLVEEPSTQERAVPSGRYQTSSKLTQDADPAAEPEPQSASEGEREIEAIPTGAADGPPPSEPQPKVKAKKKKPKLLSAFDKGIRTEIEAADKLRKKGHLQEALREFESLVRKYPQSPRARFGRAQAEDDLAERLRSNDLLLRAINSYREAADLPDVTSDLLRAALKRRAERQQFLGRTRGSLATLERLVQIFPGDVGLMNDLGVAHLLLGDNKGAKRVYEEVLAVAPDDGFAKVHYGFILKSENKIVESIPYLREGLESDDPGTDDGRFYFHLGEALQRVGDASAYQWFERGHQRGHFASVWQRSLYNVAGLKAQCWWTAQETGYTELVKDLERNWKTVRDEGLAVMDHNTGLFQPEQENLRERGEWGQYTLWQQGRRVSNTCQKVPKTCALMEKYPESTGCKRGQVKFSVMQPGTHVWPHTGPTNCRLRMHLGLVVPKTGTRIRCINQTRWDPLSSLLSILTHHHHLCCPHLRGWEEGKVLIFDDSFEHEVWQEAETLRLIFIVDVWHPELSPQQRQTLSAI
ncbi:aspartyl/asparaginyl beta-hydroxylase isoform X7 [Synchiropus splendidus]|uniref:aspartyl/asparaginyl beta-hydroxylase isoform X7 n=1 Tax=Synchiropus splendidus TaxID=270530 RepID=UPI00237DEEB3|nr:aspartyl/asparaginyl beta-hydroxylase isoform X7 [Synchiropus splendidus]